MSSKIVLMKIVLIIVLLTTAFFTLALAVTDESPSSTENLVNYDLTFNQDQSGVILQQDNYFWGAFFRIPNTYILSFTTSTSAQVGLVIIDDVNQPELDNLDNVTYDYLASLQGSDSLKFSIPAQRTTNQTVDYYNSAYSYYIAIIIFDIQTTVSMHLDISVTINSNLPFPDITYVFITIQVFALAYLLTPSENTDNKFKKFIRDHSLDATVGIIVAYSFISEYLLDSLFLYFAQILLLFFAIHKSKVYEVMLSVRLNQGQRLLASIYLTSLLSYFTTINYHINVPADVKAIQFLVYIGTDLLEPLFWIIFGIFVYRRLSLIQLQNGRNETKLINFIIAISTILVFEYSFTFFSSLIQTFEIIASDFIAGNLFLRLIQAGWVVLIAKKGWNRLRHIEEDHKSWLTIFETPDFQDVILGLHAEKDLLILLYGSIIIFRWFQYMSVLVELFIRFDYIYYAIAGILLFISTYPVWSLVLRLIQEDDDWRVNTAVLHAFLIIATSYSVILTLHTFLFPMIFGEYTYFISSIFLTSALIFSIKVYKEKLNLPLDQKENVVFPKTLFYLFIIATAIDFLSDGLFYILIGIIGPYFILPGFLIITIGMVLRNLEINGTVQNLYSSERKVVVLVLSVIGFFSYIFLDPLGLYIALQFYGLFVLMFFVSERLVDSNVVLEQPEGEEPSLDLSSLSIPIVEIIGLTVLFVLYYFFYLQQGANEGLDTGFDYFILLFGSYFWVAELMIFYMLMHPVNKNETSSHQPTRTTTQQVQRRQTSQPASQVQPPIQSQPQIPTDTQKKQFCTKCGNKLQDDQKFCNKCGTAV